MKETTFISFSKTMLHAYNKMCEPLLKEFQLPQVSFDILLFLANNPECTTAQEISELRYIKKNLVSVHVEKLVKAELLQRSTVAGDRRKIALICTEKAQPIIEKGRKMQRVYFEAISKGISEEKWTIFRDILDTIEKNAKFVAEL